MTTSLKMACLGLLLWSISQPVGAQDLDPRAYVRLPSKTYTLIPGYSYSYGAMLTDPSYPIQGMDAKVHSATIGYAQTFSFFGLSGQFSAALPYVCISRPNCPPLVGWQRSDYGWSDLPFCALLVPKFYKCHTRK